jgi:type IV pilus assembly protein PilQ
MGLSDNKRHVLIALLCFSAAGFGARFATAALNETTKTLPASAETEQSRQKAMDQLMQKMIEPTKSAEPVRATSEPAKPKKAPAQPKAAETVKPVVPAKPAMPVKTTTKPAESVKSALPVKKVEPPKAIEKHIDPAKVNIDFTDVPLSEILATIAQNTDLNIIGGEELSQKITIHLKDVPLDALFDIILKTTDYGYIQEGKVVRIVPKIDLPTETEVFTLQFASAEKVMEAVAHLLSQKGKIKSFSNFSQNTSTNILVVTDVQESMQAIRSLVEKLDKKVKQVMIEVKFCEVTLDKDDELGIDWVIRASITGSRGNTTFPLGRTGKWIYEAPYGMGVPSGNMTTGTMSFSDFSATLHALDSKTKVKLIATPQVAARSGETAQIIIGDKIPIPTYERSKETGSMEVTGYEYENVGILLKVIPFVNSDNSVTLNIHPEVSEITGYTGPNDERPIVSTREITTVFTVVDGETIVLGGLKKQTITASENKVPFLGNIPLLGRALFTYKGDSDERKELLLFITPHVLDNPKKGEAEGKPPDN